MNDTSSLDPRAQRWATLAKWAALLGVGFLVAPYVWIAIGGLVGLLVAGAIMGTTWFCLPWLQMKAANLRLSLIKHEAAVSPVPTLQNEHARQTEALNQRKEGIETLAGANRTVAETISKLEREFPDSPELPQLRQDYADLCDYQTSVEAEWKACYVTLGEFSNEIRRASRLWDAAVAIAKARGLSSLSQEEWTAKLKTETSFDAIRNKLNTGLAGLNVDKMRADADRILKGKQTKNVTPVAALPAPSSTAIPVEALDTTNAPVRARR
jgi:hypothetical protein